MKPLTDKEYKKLMEQEPRLEEYIQRKLIEQVARRAYAVAHSNATKRGIAAARKRKAEAGA